MTDTPHLCDACPSGEHAPTWDADGAPVCADCGLAAQTIVDWLGDRFR